MAGQKPKSTESTALENHPPGAYEIDHLISISLGGSNDIKNLWPQTEYDKT
jgi:5-methylcytosine-specific restriction endonuclease McrA